LITLGKIIAQKNPTHGSVGYKTRKATAL